jgi:hypothetical protein
MCYNCIMTNKKTLTTEEQAKIANLTSKQIITTHPDLVTKALGLSDSLTNALGLLGISKTNNRARFIIKDFALANNISIPVFDPTLNRPSTTLTKEDVLLRLIDSDKTYGTSLREWLIRFELLDYKCAISQCKNQSPVWLGKKLVFDLDHINGNNTDNRIENLRFLCPNCHSQTETYKGRNSRTFKNAKIEYCIACGEISRNGNYCRACDSDSETEVPRMTFNERLRNFANLPEHSVLIEELRTTNRVALQKKYKVSQWAFDSYLKDPNFTYKPVEQWNRPPITPYPPVQTMVDRILVEGYEGLARELGVSGNAIRKFLRGRLGEAPKKLKSPATL